MGGQREPPGLHWAGRAGGLLLLQAAAEPRAAHSAALGGWHSCCYSTFRASPSPHFSQTVFVPQFLYLTQHVSVCL